MSENKDVSKKDMDPELDDLLDSALQDMTRKPEKPEEPSAEVNEVPSNMWSEEYIKEAAAQFESNMAAILSSFGGVPEDQITQDQIAQTFTKMAEAAAKVLKPTADSAEDSSVDTEDPEVKEKIDEPAIDGAEDGSVNTEDPEFKEKIDEVTAAISQTLQNLNTNAESLQTPFSDQDLANMFNSFNLGDGGQDGNMFVPFMQGMMQSLLSKEVLYPSLKDLVEKYPDWLKENKSKLDKNEYERFEKQQQLMIQVCAELEPEQESDPEDVKRKRFEKVLELMQKMQELGQPPTDLVGDMAAPPAGFAAPPGADASQCRLM